LRIKRRKKIRKTEFEKLFVEKHRKRITLRKKTEQNAKKKLNHQRLTAVWRHCGFCEYLESYSLNQNLFIFVMFRKQMPQQQAKPAGRWQKP
jgi:hypothetical protein